MVVHWYCCAVYALDLWKMILSLIRFNFSTSPGKIVIFVECLSKNDKNGCLAI